MELGVLDFGIALVVVVIVSLLSKVPYIPLVNLCSPASFFPRPHSYPLLHLSFLSLLLPPSLPLPFYVSPCTFITPL